MVFYRVATGTVGDPGVCGHLKAYIVNKLLRIPNNVDYLYMPLTGLEDTVNVVIFAGGKFHENMDQTVHLGLISRFQYYSRINVIRFFFAWKISSQSCHNRKKKPHENYPQVKIFTFTVCLEHLILDCLFVFVHNFIPLTCTVEYIKFGLINCQQTGTVIF